MAPEPPRIQEVNGYDIIPTEGVFKVYDSDQQYGPDFDSFDEAAEHADTLPSRNPPSR
ncbi:hypothetical protein C8J33_101922 [Rhizobium sp. PP-CC-3G-465]|nr:hypothetical protein C8J33_101922 [Rhizobium sp. PP-CC-3G-465]